MVPALQPQLVGHNGVRALEAAIADPDRYAIEPKVDGVRGLIVFQPDGTIETRNRQVSGATGSAAVRSCPDSGGSRRLPILWDGTALDGELSAGRFEGTMAAIYGSARHAPNLRLVVFDLRYLAGVDLRREPWGARRERLELLSQAFEPPLELSPVVEPSGALAADMVDGRLEGIFPKDRRSPCSSGGRAG